MANDRRRRDGQNSKEKGTVNDSKIGRDNFENIIVPPHSAGRHA